MSTCMQIPQQLKTQNQEVIKENSSQLVTNRNQLLCLYNVFKRVLTS